MSIINESAAYQYYCSRCIHRAVCKFMVEYCLLIDEAKVKDYGCIHYSPHMATNPVTKEPILKVVE